MIYKPKKDSNNNVEYDIELEYEKQYHVVIKKPVNTSTGQTIYPDNETQQTTLNGFEITQYNNTWAAAGHVIEILTPDEPIVTEKAKTTKTRKKA